MLGSHKCAITTVQSTPNHVDACIQTTLNIYSKTMILQFCGDQLKWHKIWESNIRETLFLWASGQDHTSAHNHGKHEM